LLARLAQPASTEAPAELFNLLSATLGHEAQLQQTLEAALFDFGDNRWHFSARLAAPGADASLLSRFSADTRLQLADPAALMLTEMYLANAAARGETPPTAAEVLTGLSDGLGILVRQADGYVLQVGIDVAADTLTLGSGKSLPLSTLLPGMALLFSTSDE
jgi:hypothetical protein